MWGNLFARRKLCFQCTELNLGSCFGICCMWAKYLPGNYFFLVEENVFSMHRVEFRILLRDLWCVYVGQNIYQVIIFLVECM